MPILPAHVGPPLFIGALSGRKLNLTVLITSALFIDIEVLFWGIQYDEHGYLHTFGGATIFGIVYGAIFFFLFHRFWKLRYFRYSDEEILRKIRTSERKDWRYSSKCIVISSVIGAYSHVSLDWLMYDNIKVLAISDVNLFYMLTSTHRSLAIVLVYAICLFCFIFGLLFFQYRKAYGKNRTYQVSAINNLPLDGIHYWTLIGIISTPFAIAGIGSIMFFISLLNIFPKIYPPDVSSNVLFISILAVIGMGLGYYKALKNVNWKLFE